MQLQQELAAQKEELRHPAVGKGHQQDLVEVVDADGPEDKEATEALPAAQPKIPSTSTVFICVGYAPSRWLDARQRQPSIESYGANTQNSSDSWVNEDDLQRDCYVRVGYA
jgi:hypothetical protein